MNLIVASQNANKIAEIRAKLPQYAVVGLDQQIFTKELLETGSTLEVNAIQKARQVYTKTGASCFADDTGLEVEALGGEPGVYSARYAGEQKSSDDNMALLLTRLKNRVDRRARFRTVIALILEGNEYTFEGVCEGYITESKSGSQGFGYDPIFRPEGFDITFAEMDMETKSTISHRGKAIDALIHFLESHNS